MSDSRYAILGIDPGLVTGVFLYRSDGATFPQQLRRDEVDCALYGNLWHQSDVYGPDSVHIAIERYIITAKTAKLSQQPDALEVTGAVKGFAQVHGITDVRQYLKANLKFASDDMLRRMGWYSPTMHHANDAARQASALLKEVDYPRWSSLVSAGMIEETTNEGMINDGLPI